MSLTTLPRPLPPSLIASSGMALRRLGVGRAVPAARRTYWSFRCGKPGRYWNYQYWGATTPARSRHWPTGSLGEESKATSGGEQEVSDDTVKTPAGNHSIDQDGGHRASPNSSTAGKGETAQEPAKNENEVQSEENRFLMDEWSAWEKAARDHANVRLEFLRRALEKDPYAMLFGGREARGVWNPWRQKDGFWQWPSLRDRWGRRTRGMTDYVEARSHDLAKIFEEVRKELEQESKDGETIVGEKDGVKKATKKDVKVEEKGGREIETTTESSRSTTIPSVQSGDVYIDLITLRKVQRVKPEKTDHKSSSPLTSIQSQENSSLAAEEAPLKPMKQDEEYNLPVKTFQKADSVQKQREAPSNGRKDPASPRSESKVAGFASQEWLKREGFAPKEDSSSPSNRPGPWGKAPLPAPKTVHTPPVIHATAGSTLPVPHHQSTQIQSVLDRWPAKKSSLGPSNQRPTAGLQDDQFINSQKETNEHLRGRVAYEPKETTRDDVDLLRASDIRAASGKVTSRASKPDPAEISARRNDLARQFAESQHDFETALRKEVIDTLKHSTSPTKSPLWALWMLYDRAGRKDWEEWLRRKTFSIKGEKELKEMQYMSKAFLDQMPSPSETFASGGSGLSRYLDANRVSLALNAAQAALSQWHMEMQSVLVPRGVRPFSDDILENVRRAMAKYHIELRRQILSGTGPQIIRTRDPATEKRRAAADEVLAKEVASQRAAMDRYEQKPRNIGNQSGGKRTFEQWMPPGTPSRAGDVVKAVAQAHRDAKLSHEIRDIYEAEYGKITPEHRQAKDDRIVEGQRVIWDENPELINKPMKPTAPTKSTEPAAAESTKKTEQPSNKIVEDVTSAGIHSTSSEAPIPGKNEAQTVLLTLAHRTGKLTLHPSSLWPLLQAQLPTDVSPLESPALCSFLSTAAEPQRVLREIVALQAKGFRLVSGRKECLVFQQSAPIGELKAESLQQGKDMEAVAPKPDVAAEGQAQHTASATTSSLESSKSKPIPSVASTGASTVKPSGHSNLPPPLQAPYTPTSRLSPDPNQPIRRTEPHFMGQSSGPKATPEPPLTQAPSSNSPDQSSFPPPPGNFSHRHHRHAPRWQHRRHRRPVRRFFRAISRVLVSALLVAWGAYSVGIVLEWLARRKAWREIIEQEGQRSSDTVSAAIVTPIDPVPDALRRWLGRVWWLGEGDMVAHTEWEESRRKWVDANAAAAAERDERRRARRRVERELRFLDAHGGPQDQIRRDRLRQLLRDMDGVSQGK